MKKILFRKLLYDCTLFFIITLISTSIIIWIFQAVNFLDIIIEDGRSYSVYLKYTLFSLPKIISKILPFSIFFSLFYVFGKYEINNEFLIFWNYGIHKIKIINFFLFFSFLLLAIQIFFTSFVVPKFQNISRQIIKSSESKFFENFLKPKQFIDAIGGITFFIDEKDKFGELKNIYIKKDTGKDKFEITFAKIGYFKNKDNKRVLELNDGKTISGFKNDFKTINFSSTDLLIGDTDLNVVVVDKIQENSTNDLIKCANALYKKQNLKNNFENCTNNNFTNILKELYKRMIIPFYIPLLFLTSLIIITKSKETINFTKFRIFIFITGLALIIFSETTLKFIDNNIYKNIVITLIPIFLLSLLYLILFYFFKMKFVRLKL